jgi:hypothetical protein
MALHPDRACTGFAPTALGRYAHVDLDVIKTHAAACGLGNGFVVHSAADADDHGLNTRWIGFVNDN